MLFGINQGGTFDDLRIWHMQQLAGMPVAGIAIGGLAVGEPTETMYHILDILAPYTPEDKPRYLMGVGTPSNIIEAVARGVDFFDWRHAGQKRPAWSAVYMGGRHQYEECQVYL